MNFLEISCPICSTNFTKKNYKHIFCSPKCYQKSNANNIQKYQAEYRKHYVRKSFKMVFSEKKCVVCNSLFVPKQRKHRFCTAKCCRINRYKEQRLTMGKLLKLPRIIKDKCEICGFDNALALHFHHLNPKVRNTWDKNNVIVLCANHHNILHGKIGFSKSIILNREEVWRILGKEFDPLSQTKMVLNG